MSSPDSNLILPFTVNSSCGRFSEKTKSGDAETKQAYKQIKHIGSLLCFFLLKQRKEKSEILFKLKNAGIRWLALGIESGSAHVRDGAEKAFSQQEIKDIVHKIQLAGIPVSYTHLTLPTKA